MDIFYRYLLFFAIYGFIGWMIESAFCSIVFKKPVNRGFLNGPLIPVYAFGALALLFVSHLLPRMEPIPSIIVVFLVGVIVTSLVEYFTGWLLEFLFQSKWWDYSDHKYNIKGRVCLENSLSFGVMTVALIYLIHPAIAGMVAMIPPALRMWLSVIFITVVIADLTVTVFTILNLNKRLQSIQTGMQTIKEKLDSFQFDMTSGIRERIVGFYESHDMENQLYKPIVFINEHIKQMEHDNKVLQKRILNAFPSLRSLKYPEYLNGIKEQIGILIKKKS